ncbi:MAG: sulfatase-like hydrolase/transferase, partial [Planctomycetes bacterium]|nr:sulfatase-like hydrolase/transferase [Planctomycetota bacterium]
DRVDLIDQEAEFRDHAPQEYWDTFGAMTSDLDEEHHSTTWIGDRACAEIDNWKSGGNLLMVGFIKPHHPFDPPAPWSAMYDPASLSLLPGWTETLHHGDEGKGYFNFGSLTEESLRRVMAMYYACISQIDHHVGRMVNALKQLGLYEDTIIVYTSDHGEYMGSHHRLLKNHNMIDPLVRVPLIIKGLGSGGPRGRDSRLVNNIDVAPSLLSAADLPLPATMIGLDLNDSGRTSEYVFAEDHKGQYMVRSTRDKLLLSSPEKHSMYFDLTTDPLELTNLYCDETYRGRINELIKALLDWRLFRARPPCHLHREAATCRSENVSGAPGPTYEYFKRRMETAMSTSASGQPPEQVDTYRPGSISTISCVPQ